jgi:hypothetical protein
VSDEAARLRRARQTTLNLLYSLAATAAIVLVMVLITPRPSTNLVQPVDYKAAAQEIRDTAKLPVLTPKLLGSGWYSNSARWNSKTADGVDNWYVGFVGPKNQYLGITQGFKANPTWVMLQLKGDLPQGAVSIGGKRWTVWQSTTKNDPAKTRDYALVTDVTTGSNTDSILVYGTASKAQFRQFATLVAQQLKVLYP